MIRHSRSVLQKARELEDKREYVVHVGVSLMNPAGILLEHWHKISTLYPNLRLEVVPFEDTVPAFQEVLNHLGDKIDLVSCPYETDYWGDRYNSFHLRDLPLRISCSKSHPLAQKERLKIEDLYGQILLIGKRNYKSFMDRVRDFLEREHPQIHIQETDAIDLPLFNRIVSSHDLLLSADCWKDVHPLLATLPVEWDFTMPYGLIYAKDPQKEMVQFIMALGNVLT